MSPATALIIYAVAIIAALVISICVLVAIFRMAASTKKTAALLEEQGRLIKTIASNQIAAATNAREDAGKIVDAINS